MFMTFLGKPVSHWLGVSHVMEKHNVPSAEVLDELIQDGKDGQRERRLFEMLRKHTSSDHWAGRLASKMVADRAAYLAALR